MYSWANVHTLHYIKCSLQFQRKWKKFYLSSNSITGAENEQRIGSDRTRLCSVWLNHLHLRLGTFRYCYITSWAELISVGKYQVLTWGMRGQQCSNLSWAFLMPPLSVMGYSAENTDVSPYHKFLTLKSSDCRTTVRNSSARVVSYCLRAMIAMAEIWGRTQSI